MQVTIFTTVKCPHCSELRQFLNDNHLSYVERDINTDTGARMELLKRKIIGIPTIFIDNEIIVGFNLIRLEEVLRK